MKNRTIETAEMPATTFKPLGMHPKKFALWLGMASIVMAFASLTSAYIVRQAEGNWNIFALPDAFYISTAVIFASSITMHWAYLAAKKDNLGQVKLALILTNILGYAFLYFQWQGYGELITVSVHLVGNPSGSFVYVISGLHALHIVGALVFLLITTVKAFSYRVHAKNLITIEMCTSFWHFLDIVWIYLFIFLLLNR